ncbi:urease subunit beta [Caldilinea aerophila]|jgi:urease beta subunit|uniref:urease subunit beta n=1 Tax=Caldilinea aerophila TaxID=133453 RepID=UPI0002FA9C43|nr:urease subunit beta [Caldilinea aerophila]
MIPGEILVDDRVGPIQANEGREVVTVLVAHTGDRPIQVGSHFHFFEVNRALRFDRRAAYGMRLNIPAGTAVRFEPGDVKEVSLTPLAGNRIATGFNGLVQGALDDPAAQKAALGKAIQKGFLSIENDSRVEG